MLVLLAVATSSVLTTGSSGAAKRPTKFEGSCHLTGEVTFRQPIGDTPRSVTFIDTATGTCTGDLDDRPVQDVPVVNRARGGGTLSCGSGEAHAVDRLRFARQYRLRILTDVVFAGTQAVGHSNGATSGESVETVTFHADAATLAACQAGTLRSARYDLDARTITPLVG